MATREELKETVERVAAEHGHRLGPWLDVGHASQTGCLDCDRYAFAEVLPPPGKLHVSGIDRDCPRGAGRLIELD